MEIKDEFITNVFVTDKTGLNLKIDTFLFEDGDLYITITKEEQERGEKNG